MTLTISKGDFFTIVEDEGAAFFKKHPCIHGSLWTRSPAGAGTTPEDVGEYEQEDEEDQTVTLSEAHYVEDDNDNVYFRIVGGRPKGTRRN